MEKLYLMKHQRKAYHYEQIDFKNLMERYLVKAQAENSIEGIYSVTSVISKKSRSLFSSDATEKIKDQRQNYATVAIISDRNKNNGREYIEIPVDKNQLPSYSIRGEFTQTPDGNIFIYKHFEPKNKIITYTFTFDTSTNVLDGIRTENQGAREVTYKLSYVRLYPKR
jgi:hypothetical protein